MPSARVVKLRSTLRRLLLGKVVMVCLLVLMKLFF
jgi:hypothetical protein